MNNSSTEATNKDFPFKRPTTPVPRSRTRKNQRTHHLSKLLGKGLVDEAFSLINQSIGNHPPLFEPLDSCPALSPHLQLKYSQPIIPDYILNKSFIPYPEPSSSYWTEFDELFNSLSHRNHATPNRFTSERNDNPSTANLQ